MSIKPFTLKQEMLIKHGANQTEMLGYIAQRAMNVSGDTYVAKRHYYIKGPSSIGKTACITQTAALHGIKLLNITSSMSMNSFVIKMATAVYSREEGETIYVYVDDCDTLFNSTEALGVMKGVLDEDRNILAWNKNLTGQLMTHERSQNETDQLIAKALRKYQTAGGVGVSIPMDNISFIITSNHGLTPNNPLPPKGRKTDEAAVRDRVAYKEYDLSSEETWGWVAYLTLTSSILSIEDDKKRILLDWMYTNWNELPDVGLRFIKELEAEMLNKPNSYPDLWELHLRKRK
jgi:hypothetical protein